MKRTAPGGHSVASWGERVGDGWRTARCCYRGNSRRRGMEWERNVKRLLGQCHSKARSVRRALSGELGERGARAMGGCRASPGANSRRPEIAWERNVNGLMGQCCSKADGVRRALCAELHWRGGRHTRGHYVVPGDRRGAVRDGMGAGCYWIAETAPLHSGRCPRGALWGARLSEGGRS